MLKGLIVEEHKEAAQYIGSVLEQSKVNYDIFVNPKEALKDMEKKEYDFAFVDIKMPLMDGFSFSRRFKKQFPEADIILITGYGDYEKAVQTIKIGACDFIQKPFKYPDIRMCVTRIIEKRRLYGIKKRMEMLKLANNLALQLMHEMRNPLIIIGGFSRLIYTHDYPRDKRRQFEKIIFEEVVRLESALKEVLIYLKHGISCHQKGNNLEESPKISCHTHK